jgi:predicted RNA-binding protein YlqC (UPF0109 family)
MKDLLTFLVEEMTGSKEFEIQESAEEGRHDFMILAPQEMVGMLIGKEGRTIKAIRNLLKVKATLEKEAVSVSVGEKA